MAGSTGSPSFTAKVPFIPRTTSPINVSIAPGGASATIIGTGGVVRRKVPRRANTAERRATHNAVERQRRETLNGRFLVRPTHSSFLF